MKYTAWILGASVLALSVESKAHNFRQETNETDGAIAGNSDVGTEYAWYGRQANYESNSSTAQARGSYATQGFTVIAKTLGATQQFRISVLADSSYRKAGTAAATYQTRTETTLVKDGLTIAKCIDAGNGCAAVHNLIPSLTARKDIDFGFTLGTHRVRSTLTGDISFDIGTAVSAGRFTTGATGSSLNARATLVATANLFALLTMDEARNNYRLIEVTIDANEYSRQATLGATTTTGAIFWENQEYLDLALMDGKASFTVSDFTGLTQRTRTLVDYGPDFWTGQWINNVGSTQSF